MMNILASLWMVFAVLQAVTAGHHHNQSSKYCKPKCPLFDPPRGAVLLPGPTKEHFYMCNFGVGILFKCSRGTHFNPKKKVCDWPSRARAVVCRGSPDYENEGSGDGEF